LQINLTGFLDADAGRFIEELWGLLVSAQENIGGIPKIFLEQKKSELKQKQVIEEIQRGRYRERFNIIYFFRMNKIKSRNK
jgi:PWI domain